MRPRWPAVLLILCALTVTALAARRWAMYEHEMQDAVDDPPDWAVTGEFSFGRLRYRSNREGRRYARWGIDCNKGDRIFLSNLRRLTRVNTQSIENIIDIESDEIFDSPFMLAISPDDWRLTQTQADRLRKFFDRGGFMMVDDFHGERDWAGFMRGLQMIYPDVQIVELADNEPIFHTVFNLADRVQVPGQNVVHGPGYEKDGVFPHWRGAIDKQGRIFLAICFNMDIGDGWEFADDPDYPEKFSAHALRLGVNYAIYAMTH